MQKISTKRLWNRSKRNCYCKSCSPVTKPKPRLQKNSESIEIHYKNILLSLDLDDLKQRIVNQRFETIGSRNPNDRTTLEKVGFTTQSQRKLSAIYPVNHFGSYRLSQPEFSISQSLTNDQMPWNQSHKRIPKCYSFPEQSLSF